MKKKIFLILVLIFSLLIFSVCSGETKTKTDAKDHKEMTNIDYKNIQFETITGDTASLAEFKGKVVLLVNVASKCGFTKQYAGLEELYQTFKDSGLVVIGFPANNFGGQEPGTNEEILEFCTTNFGVSFPMMSKISVKGENKHPLYVYLTEQSNFAGEIKWNFTKFLFDREGKPTARFGSMVKPMSKKITVKIKELL
jgi:glutathione peroxidase